MIQYTYRFILYTFGLKSFAFRVIKKIEEKSKKKKRTILCTEKLPKYIIHCKSVRTP